MKKRYIDFNVCFDCEHCKKNDNLIECDLNNIILAYSIDYFKQKVYINIDSSTLKKSIPELVNEKFDSLYENIDERCPRKIEHTVRCQDKRFTIIKK